MGGWVYQLLLKPDEEINELNIMLASHPGLDIGLNQRWGKKRRSGWRRRNTEQWRGEKKNNKKYL